jgi:hypothetical protein
MAAAASSYGRSSALRRLSPRLLAVLGVACLLVLLGIARHSRIAVGESVTATPSPDSGTADESTPSPVSLKRTKAPLQGSTPSLASVLVDTKRNGTAPRRVKRKPLNAPPRKLKTDQTEIRFITVQTKGSPGWCRMLKSAALSGIEIHNVGWGQDYAHRKRPQWILDWIAQEQRSSGVMSPADNGEADAEMAVDAGATTRAAADGFDDAPPVATPSPAAGRSKVASGARGSAARSGRPLHDWDVLVFADGADSAYTGFSPRETLSRFIGLTVADIDPTLMDPSKLSVHNPELEEPLEALQQRMGMERLRTRTAPVPLLFNAEANCYHQQLFDGVWAAKKSRCITAYKKYNPFVTSKWRYLNAGAWIGYVWAVKRFFGTARDVLAKNNALWCDQSVIGGLFLNREREPIVHIDYSNAFFLPTYHLQPGRDICPMDPHSDRDINDVNDPESAGRGLRMCHTRNIPALLHFNGKSEGGRADELLQRSVWAARARTTKGREGALAVLRKAVTFLEKASGTREVKSFVSACPGFDEIGIGGQ